ncbi:MAG: riboflavin synthase [Burkholderiaceae bacterium]|jgi:riboflavin synthase
MFTGIIAAVGEIEAVTPSPKGADAGLHLRIGVQRLPLDAVLIGDSIAVSGVCLTVTAKTPVHFEADVSAETLSCTVGLDRPGPVNLETALRLGDALGGHMVLGHVDGVGHVVRLEAVGDSFELVLSVPAALARFCAYKGSIAVNGVSLTINRVADHDRGSDISINLIPHTVAATTLRLLGPGAAVNLEVDLIARYTDRLLSVTPR